MFRRIVDLLLIIGIALVAMVCVLLSVESRTIQAVFGLPFALFLPGYALTAAIFPQRKPGVPERFLLSLGLSLAIGILAGLLLHWTPRGLVASSWAVLLFGITLSASLIALLRRWQVPAEYSAPVGAGLNLQQVFLFGLAALVIAAALGLARRPTHSQGIEGYTQLWMLPVDQLEQSAIFLGITNMEFSPQDYHLRVELDGRVTHEWPAITLKPGEDWQTIAVLPASESGTGPVRAFLYRLEEPEQAYRQVEWWPDRQ